MKLPRATERKLKNGLPAMVIESQRSPSVAVELAPSSTSLMNPEGMPGVAAARCVAGQFGYRQRRPRANSAWDAEASPRIAGA